MRIDSKGTFVTSVQEELEASMGREEGYEAEDRLAISPSLRDQEVELWVD